jgi:DNA-directed RNA polymerase specialized sigma24 family protein
MSEKAEIASDSACLGAGHNPVSVSPSPAESSSSSSSSSSMERLTPSNWPGNIPVEVVLAAIDNALRILAPKFTFGIYGLDDIYQEGRVWGIEAMPRYDPSLPVGNFLYTHIRNRLSNLRRDKLKRNDPPCQVCHRAEGKHTAHEDGQFCARYLSWKKRNERKANLMRPYSMEAEGWQEKGDGSSPVGEMASLKEVERAIDEELDADLRGIYLQMKAGQPVPRPWREQVEDAVRDILEGR